MIKMANFVNIFYQNKKRYHFNSGIILFLSVYWGKNAYSLGGNTLQYLGILIKDTNVKFLSQTKSACYI